MIGKSVLHYEIQEKLGAGGMGEVYLASDSKLGRDVALKVLPEHLASDPDRMARFRREAQVLASLNHANIGAIYGLEETDGVRCLVLELVRGETLSDRIARGPLPLDEALPIAKQIAEAMETAHDRGILHRDLKPGNVMITPDGSVKVLDFGLAKALETESAQRDMSWSPTLTAPGTMIGVILGTAAYMSPEQAKGKPVDRRADIWAFGIILFEMLTGQQAYSGETVSEVLAAVMMREIDWERLPKDLPRPIENLLRRCLDKDPRRRLRDIGDARIVLEDYLANPAAATATAAEPAAPASAAGSRLPWLVAGLAAVAAAVALWGPWRSGAPPQSAQVMDFDVELSPDPLFSGYGAAAVLSRQGDRIAFVTDSGRQLFVRDLNDPEPRAVQGTDLAYHQFFSPAGDWIGFFTRTDLKKVSVRGGSPLVLASVSLNRGGTWLDDGTIVYAPTPSSSLLRIPESGGAPDTLTRLEAAVGEASHRWPSWIPGTSSVLFASFQNAYAGNEGRIEVVDVNTKERKTLHHGGTYPRYSPTGHILYLYDGTLFALPFDKERMEVRGLPGPVLESIGYAPGEGGAQFDFSDNGIFVGSFNSNTSGGVADLILQRFDGSTEALVESLDVYGPAVSPDGRSVMYTIGSFGAADVWVMNLERRTQTRLTFAEQKADWHAVWSPDGNSFAYSSNQGNLGAAVLHIKPADGSGEPRRVGTGTNLQAPESFSPDGSLLVYSEAGGSAWDISYLDLNDGGESKKFVESAAIEWGARISPDGRWVAYESNESGRFEIYVRPFPGPGGKWQISSQGGFEPRWSRDGRQLFFRTEEMLYSVPIELSAGAVNAGNPSERMPLPGESASLGGSYDLLADGSGVITTRDYQEERDIAPLRRVRVTLNWFDRLRELAPKPTQ